MFCVCCYRCYLPLAKTEHNSKRKRNLLLRRIKFNIKTQIVILSSFPQTNRKYIQYIIIHTRAFHTISYCVSWCCCAWKFGFIEWIVFFSLAALWSSFIRSRSAKIVPSEKDVQCCSLQVLKGEHNFNAPQFQWKTERKMENRSFSRLRSI